MVDVLRNFTMIFERPDQMTRLSFRLLPRFIGIMMIAFALTDIYYYTLPENADLFVFSLHQPLILFSDTIVCIAGVSILLRKNPQITSVASTYLISIGLGRLLVNFGDIFTPELGLMGHITFAKGLVLSILSINLLVTGFNFWKGMSRNRTTVMASVSIFVIINVVIVAQDLHHTESLEYFMVNNANIILQTIMYISFLAVLDTMEIRGNAHMESINSSLTSVRVSSAASRETALSIHESELIIAGFSTMEGWTKVEDGGPVDYETGFIISNEDTNADVIVQKWKGSDKLYFTISDNIHGSIVYARRFAARRYVQYAPRLYADGWIRLIDDDGSFVKFSIINDDAIDRLHQEA